MNKFTTKIYLTVLLICIANFYSVAQNPILTSLQQQFETYNQNAIQEKVFIHSDKDDYIAGELCWFKIYTVDAFFHQPLSLSKIAYVEVLDKNNKAVLQAKIPLRQGKGNGSFFLSASLVSGNYTLRGYTNWMKNYSQDYFFEKNITIINAQKIYKIDTAFKKETYNLTLFPEGGNLINGIQSKIAFHAVNQYGKGINGDGVVVNEKNDTIIKFTAQQFGIGSFLFLPDPAHTYKAVYTIANSEKIIQNLPIAYNTGYVMQLTAINNNDIKITVQTPVNNSFSPIVYLFAHTRGVTKCVLNSNMVNGVAVFIVNKNKLGDGISHFTILNAEKQPVCERLYFKYPEKKLQITTATSETAYAPREKITVQINTIDENSKTAPANLSIAVYRIDTLQKTEQLNIDNYLWLSSDLTGTIESPAYYFNNINNNGENAMDNLMLTHGWRKFNWNDILQNKKPVFEFLPEYAGHIVTGKVTTTVSQQLAPNMGVYLSVPGVQTQFRNAVSDKNGQVQFNMPNFYNDGSIIVQTNVSQDTIYGVKINNPFIEKYTKKITQSLTTALTNNNAFINQYMGVQVQHAYQSNKLNQFILPSIDTNAFYVKPDLSYLLDNYVRFTTMEEVFREYVALVNVRKKNGKYQLPVMDILVKEFSETDPLLLLDGVPIFDVNKFMAYDPLKIRKLEVMSRVYYLGNMVFQGVVNAQTYQGDLNSYEIDPKATILDYEGLQMQRSFYSPIYETPQQKENRMPDFRNLLYWNPDIKTNEKGNEHISFYSSDAPGTYAIFLQGITPNGRAGSKVIKFVVKER